MDDGAGSVSVRTRKRKRVNPIDEQIDRQMDR